MASDKTDRKEKKLRDKAEKKEKKRSEADGVGKEKKDKKKDKKRQEKLAQALDAHLQADVASKAADVKVDPEDLVRPADELVPFALPLADEKTHKKAYKLIKKGAKLKAIHRGVKECEKAIRKCPLKKTSGADQSPPGLVIIAGDISPMDVIMHFPVLCEEHGVPYVFVRSRADLGMAACTKRATSVVMLRPGGKQPPAGGSGKKDGGGDEEAAAAAGDAKVDAGEYLEAWGDLVKLAEKQWVAQVEPWVKGTHPLQLAASGHGSLPTR